jgi:flagellum-specific peptidoglycan hydrolase FlgJ
MATEQQLANLHAVVPAAQASAKTFGVPASVTLAQWVFESSWGTSKLALQANNFFGIKARQGNLPDSYVEMPTAEYEAGKRVIIEAHFRKYESAIESFDDHAFLLAESPRYKPAMDAAKDPAKFAQMLQACGYSTNPNYAAELVDAIRDYNLTEYDIMPATPAS